MFIGGLLLALYILISRYQIGVDDQGRKCIPGYTIYLIDKKDKVMDKGKIYAYGARRLEPFYKEGHVMIKFLRGVPGDELEVTAEGSVLINGIEKGKGLYHAKTLNRPETDFIGRGVVKPGQYWVMGLTETSFDSRYFGAIERDQVIGRAYPLF